MGSSSFTVRSLTNTVNQQPVKTPTPQSASEGKAFWDLGIWLDSHSNFTLTHLLPKLVAVFLSVLVYGDVILQTRFCLYSASGSLLLTDVPLIMYSMWQWDVTDITFCFCWLNNAGRSRVNSASGSVLQTFQTVWFVVSAIFGRWLTGLRRSPSLKQETQTQDRFPGFVSGTGGTVVVWSKGRMNPTLKPKNFNITLVCVWVKNFDVWRIRNEPRAVNTTLTGHSETSSALFLVSKLTAAVTQFSNPATINLKSTWTRNCLISTT